MEEFRRERNEGNGGGDDMSFIWILKGKEIIGGKKIAEENYFSF